MAPHTQIVDQAATLHHQSDHSTLSLPMGFRTTQRLMDIDDSNNTTQEQADEVRFNNHGNHSHCYVV